MQIFLFGAHNFILPKHFHDKRMSAFRHLHPHRELKATCRMEVWNHRHGALVLQIVNLRFNGAHKEAVVDHQLLVGGIKHLVHQRITQKLAAIYVLDPVHNSMRFQHFHGNVDGKSRCQLGHSESVEQPGIRDSFEILHKVVVATRLQ